MWVVLGFKEWTLVCFYLRFKSPLIIKFHGMRTFKKYFLEWLRERMIKKLGIFCTCKLMSLTQSSHLSGSHEMGLFLHEGKLSLNCFVALGTPWLTIPAGTTKQNREMPWTGLQQESRKKERRFGSKAGRKCDRAHWVRMRERERRCPAPQIFPFVWIRPSLSLKLFVSYWFHPQCSSRHVYTERRDKTTGLHHRLWMFSKIQPSQKLILCFLSCFHCRELCGVPETECEQPQPCVPAERHLSRHGVLGVSGTQLVSLGLWGLHRGSAQLTLPLEKAWPFLHPHTSWLLWVFACIGSQSRDL